MKAFIAAVLVAGLAAYGASFVLDTVFQRPVEQAYSTSGVRL